MLNLTNTIASTVSSTVGKIKLTATTNDKILKATSLQELSELFSEASQNGCTGLLEAKVTYLKGREALEALSL